MRKISLLTTLLVSCFFGVNAQSKIPTDTVVTTQHEATINGQHFTYYVHKGMQPVWNKDGKVAATVGYTYYERAGVSDKSTRPITISFNGGPGSASLWMELGYTGPVRVNLDDAGHAVQPYGLKENPYSILDATDIVYVDPVNTGYSRIVDKDAKPSMFFGVNEDIDYLAKWISTFVTRNNRWLSPKFLIGESYGTTRVSGLAAALQEPTIGMFLNGVILVSPTELGIRRDGPINEAINIPYYAATAWYYKKLPADLQQKQLTDILPQIEDFTVNQLIPAIAKGGSISESEKQNIETQLERYTSIKKEVWDQNNLDVNTNLFWKELLRDKGYTIGRLDSRYLGIDERVSGSYPDFNAEIPAWSRSFSPAANYYMRNDLNFKTDVPYLVLSDQVYPWNSQGDRTGAQLREAMEENPSLHLLVQSGYYDGSSCNFFNAKYSMWQMATSANLKARMEWKGYPCGHMVYMDKPTMIQGDKDIRDFIKNAIPANNKSSDYQVSTMDVAQ
ncbi:carboxypeptidase [Arachidicoccus ginsenosidimutans]|uniref:S10 family peptidase n=1 Tax=Arachidicoccus sp. BS20 TaxID=1850526 RepID=UPI0007F05E39|nr:carboxypeptidase [Arachidicoccus sp. BS20]ANI88683.1 carboxypeptidase [Arachidicoccus sp. BS20]